LDKEASHAYHERSKVSIGMSVAAVFNAIDEWILCMKNSSTPSLGTVRSSPARHWHGARPTTAMTHIAIKEKKDGKVVDWMEHVTDDQYRAGKSRTFVRGLS